MRQISDYDLVYDDPPWRQKKGGLRNVRPNQGRKLDYPTLSMGEIKEIIARYDSDILFLWTIDKFLFAAESVGRDLGYKLHSRIVWDKRNGPAPAFTVRFSKEYLLWMYRPGGLMADFNRDVSGKFRDVIVEPAAKVHSKKPVAAYEMIEIFYPNANKIELFARNLRDGWDAWGNQVPAAEIEASVENS